MIERRVEGVAIMTFGMEEVLLEDLKLRKVPLVFVDVGPARPRVSNIRIDYLHGIRQAVQHLAAMRHERSEEHTSELQSQSNLVCRLLPEKKKPFPSWTVATGPASDSVPRSNN